MIVVGLSRGVGIEDKSDRNEEMKDKSNKERYNETEPSGVILVNVLGKICQFNLSLQNLHSNIYLLS